MTLGGVSNFPSVKIQENIDSPYSKKISCGNLEFGLFLFSHVGMNFIQKPSLESCWQLDRLLKAPNIIRLSEWI
jgi:hypothetical protein